jgi:DNA-binding transcriptional regulator YiaG
MSPALPIVRTTAEQEFSLCVGSWIYEVRTARRMSQRELGLVVGAHLNTVRNWEMGVSMPNLYQAELLKKFEKEHPVRP